MRKLTTKTAAAVVAVIMMGGSGLFLMSQNNPAAAQAQSGTTGKVERKTLNTTVEVSGSLEAEQTLTLSFGTTGTVQSVSVKVGDTVTAGQTLAALDTADLEYQVSLKEQALIVQQSNYDQLIAPPTAKEIAQAQASLASAQSNLRTAQNAFNNQPNSAMINCANVDSAQRKLQTAQDDYDTYVKDGYEQDATFIADPDSTAGSALRDAQSSYDVAQAQCNNTTTQDTYQLQIDSAQASVDQAQAALDDLMAGASDDDLKSAQASLDQAQLQLDDAKTALDDAAITAPFDGVIADVNLTVGQTVSSNTQAISLVDNHLLHINVAVDEEDITTLQIGQSADVTSDSLPDQTFKATVTQIAPVGTSSDGIVTYNVRLDLADADPAKLYVGMTTDVAIVVGSTANALTVPTEAIQRNGQQEYVEVVNATGTPTQVPVT
ncbi:MAG TPA: efflux RND transporter periplasmic adaptor subunit, partial [Phototrophicaceae bacterium]|nr:efflux RND transporter periplasmic adaptor subunit [Phototrophicaceae bacterium]